MDGTDMKYLRILHVRSLSCNWSNFPPTLLFNNCYPILSRVLTYGETMCLK